MIKSELLHDLPLAIRISTTGMVRAIVTTRADSIPARRWRTAIAVELRGFGAFSVKCVPAVWAASAHRRAGFGWSKARAFFPHGKELRERLKWRYAGSVSFRTPSSSP